MLLKNPLQPPVPSRETPRTTVPAAGAPGPFVSAEDFDVTGVLAGMDPCESCYWWMPELHTRRTAAAPVRTGGRVGGTPPGPGHQAAARTDEPTTAAA
jgi:hypothetical protein